MQIKLPAPYPDPKAYQSIFKRGLKRFPKRRENYERYQQSIRGLEVDYLPVLMDIEPVSRCNFRCSMCQVSEWQGGKRADDMPFNDYKQLIEKFYGLVEVKIQGLGEPLFHPNLFDMIALACKKDIWTRLTTNASLLHLKNNYKKLIDANPGEVQVSIDGATKEVFENIRKGSDFKTVVKNATILNGYDQLSGNSKTRSWTVVQKANLHQLKDIIRLGVKMKFRRMSFSIAVSYFGMDKWSKKNSSIDVSQMFSQEMGEEMIELGNEYGIEITFWDGSAKYKLNGNPNDRCAWLWERAYISSDLRIVPCCVLSNPDIMDIGSMRHFVQVWNSERYKRLRDAHLKGCIPNFCKNCYNL